MADRTTPLAAALAFVAGAATAAPITPAAPEVPHRSAPVVEVQDNRVRATTDLPTAELRRLRRRMLADQWISFQDMRRLADAGDGLAAFNYGERLLATGDPDLAGAAAFYFATAAYAGRDFAVYKLVTLLGNEDLEFSERRLAHLENSLRALALRGEERAEQALVEFYETGHPFGRHPDRARSLLLEMAEEGDTDAAMKLATQALSQTDTDMAPAQIEDLLEVAMTSDQLGTRAAAQALRDQVRARSAAPNETPETDQ